MQDILDLVFSYVNAPISVFLIGMLFYWLLVILGALDIHILDFDVHKHIEIDKHIEFDKDIVPNKDFQVDKDIHLKDLANAEASRNIRKSNRKISKTKAFLVFFNFAELPFMLVFTLLITAWWFFSVSFTYFTHTYNHNTGFILFLIALIPALITTKVVTNPLKRFFKHFNSSGDNPLELLGREATLQTTIDNDKIGMAELNIEGNPIKIYVKSINKEAIQNGSKVLIIQQSEDKKIFFVEPY